MLSVGASGNVGLSSNLRRFTPNDPAQLKQVHIEINYEKDAGLLRTFVQHFSPDEKKQGFEAGLVMESEEAGSQLNAPKNATEGLKYMTMLQEVANLQRTSIAIDLDDILQFDETNDELVDRIMRNTSRYIGLCSQVLDELMPTATTTPDMTDMDVIDVIASHRRARQRATGSPEEDQQNVIPASLLRRFNLFFKPPSREKQLSVREVKADKVGGLVRIKGIITRVSEVRPLLTVGTYTCECCGYEVYQEITTQAFMPLPECPSDECRRNNNKGQLQLQTRGSRFHKFQEARIQELTEQVPMGHIPRSMAVWLVGDQSRSVTPGDQVVLSGIFMPKPYTGFKAIRAGLLTDTYLLTMHVEHLKLRYDSMMVEDELMAQVEALAQDSEAYTKLALSIAPEIYGHVDVKKALLLLMVGGVTKNMQDGMKIRGDINICLMGDPGVAKSQLLKYVTKLAPRSVYTTGKGSSGVGLTAAVTKDPITNEMVLEGGALVLADNGICCIDEFDKMDENDRTAIHEVMEQQTISISKAGITTTLNARTSILAAANPLYGRYNPKKSPRENINLPPALLSRFDLLFLLLDQPNLEEDSRLAEHVCHVHRTGQAPERIVQAEVVNAEVFRMYLSIARRYEPVVPTGLVEYIVGAYVGIRANDLNQRDTTYTTPRTLLAVLRLSQALARLRLSETVSQADVDEAMRLMDVSRSSVDVHLDRAARARTDNDPTTKILGLIRELAQSVEADDQSQVKSVPMDLIRESSRLRGFTDEQLQQCLVSFDQCNIWSVSADGTMLKIFN